MLSISSLSGLKPLTAIPGQTDRTVPDPLVEPLFGTLDTPDAPPLRTYAILDAARAPYILTGLIEASDLPHASLFQHEVQSDLAEVAPYLVELPQDNPLTRRLFSCPDTAAGLWGQGVGIYLRSPLSLEELRAHLRKFTRIPDENRKWFFFRFWEPQTFYAMSILREDSQSVFWRLWQSPQIARVLFPFQDTVWICDTAEASAEGQRAPILLRQVEKDALAHSKRHVFAYRVAHALADAHPELWRASSIEEISQLYGAACARKYTIEQAAFDFIRSTLKAREKGYAFDALERHVDPDNSLSPLNRGKRIWTFLETNAA